MVYSHQTTYFSLQFNKSERFSTASGFIDHMELDLHKNDGSILFTNSTQLQTTNGEQTSVVSSGYRSITGFKQLNSSHVVIVDYSESCLRIFNRLDESQVILAGTCGTPGSKDGPSAKLFFPHSVEFDKRNPGQLLFTEFGSGSLRSVDLTSGTVSTVISAGFNFPRGLTWFNSGLLVYNQHYISEVTWRSDGSAANNTLAGSTTIGYRNGDFSITLFSFPLKFLSGVTACF